MENTKWIFCLNSSCKHYFEDNCMKISETDMVSISEDGKCEDFETGRHVWYGDQPEVSPSGTFDTGGTVSLDEARRKSKRLVEKGK